MNVKRIPLGSYGANCYVLSGNGELAVIDPGEYRGILAAELSASVAAGGTLKYILLTHGHFDHILGVWELKKEYPDAVVAVHERDRLCLTDREASLLGEQSARLFHPVDADILLTDGQELELCGTALKVISTPGHTKGGVCFVCESEHCVFTGDTLFCKTVGRTDFPGGSTEELGCSIERLMELDDSYAVFPGHNRATTIGAERTGNRFTRRKR